LKVNKASQDKRTQEIGANVFVGNLAQGVDEKALKDVFSQFGIVVSTKVMRDSETGKSKQYGFVCFDNFESSDNAIQQMKGQYLGGKPVDVSYSFKKEGGAQAGPQAQMGAEKHGSVAERVIAYASMQQNNNKAASAKMVHF